MNVYRLLHDSYTEYVLAHQEPSGFISIPSEGEDLIIPLIIAQESESVKCSSFNSAASYIIRDRYKGETHKISIGKDTDGSNTLYLNSRFALYKDSNHRFHLLYVIGTALNQSTETYYRTIYKAVVSTKFIVDVKNLWCNGMKTHVFSSLLSNNGIEVVHETDIDNRLIISPIPKSSDYQEDISKFLKSKDAAKFIDSFLT